MQIEKVKESSKDKQNMLGINKKMQAEILQQWFFPIAFYLFFAFNQTKS